MVGAGECGAQRGKKVRIARQVNTENRLLTEQEALEILGLCDRKNPTGALRCLCRTGRLAYIRVAPVIRSFQRDDPERFIEQQRVEPKE